MGGLSKLTRGSNIKEIDSEHLGEIDRSKNVVLTIGASWCPHCQREFEETLKPTCKGLENTVCYAIDGDDSKNKAFVQSLGVQGFPHNIFCTRNGPDGVPVCKAVPGELPKDTVKLQDGRVRPGFKDILHLMRMD